MVHQRQNFGLADRPSDRRQAENSKIELLDALAWWASEEAGSLNFDSPDAEDYE